MPQGKREGEQLTLLKPKQSRAERTAGMDEEILGVVPIGLRDFVKSSGYLSF
jgi:hypothetical protein